MIKYTIWSNPTLTPEQEIEVARFALANGLKATVRECFKKVYNPSGRVFTPKEIRRSYIFLGVLVAVCATLAIFKTDEFMRRIGIPIPIIFSFLLAADRFAHWRCKRWLVTLIDKHSATILANPVPRSNQSGATGAISNKFKR